MESSCLFRLFRVGVWGFFLPLEKETSDQIHMTAGHTFTYQHIVPFKILKEKRMKKNEWLLHSLCYPPSHTIYQKTVNVSAGHYILKKIHQYAHIFTFLKSTLLISLSESCTCGHITKDVRARSSQAACLEAQECMFPTITCPKKSVTFEKIPCKHTNLRWHQ